MQPTTFIYALKDPETGEIRYVGKSNNPKKRLRGHLTDARNRKSHCTNWINSLTQQGLKPEITILDEVPEEHWEQWEVAYIEFFREQGYVLVNGTAGGEGAHSPSSTTRKKLSDLKSGKNHHFFGIKGNQNPNFGQRRTPETRALLRAKALGRKHSLETRAKMSAAHFGKKRS